MITRLLFLLVAMSISLRSFATELDEPSRGSLNRLRQEHLRLKQQISELTARLQRVERRISQLESQLSLRSRTARSGERRMRPLGSHFFVDEKGFIYYQGRRVGIWGVNGSLDRSEVSIPDEERETRWRYVPPAR